MFFFTNPCTVYFQWSFLCAGILQRICRNSVSLSSYSRLFKYKIIFSQDNPKWPIAGRKSVSQAVGPVRFPYFQFYQIFPVDLKATGIVRYMDGKNAAGKNIRLHTFCTAALPSICRNYPLNLKPCWCHRNPSLGMADS